MVKNQILKKLQLQEWRSKEKTNANCNSLLYLKLSITFTKHKCERFILCLKIGRQVLPSKQN